MTMPTNPGMQTQNLNYGAFNQMAMTNGVMMAEQPSPYPEQPFDRTFEYSHDFDECGLLYFIGSNGLTRMWQNPHSTGKVRSFASSIGSGSVENFVGREAVNCRTNNEQFAFMGVDIQDYRAFCPTSYTLRNRNSPSHVIQNWEFQASNDNFQTWIVLDRREHFTGNA